ncbi:MAG: sigma-70 family RNA polymerase sigma factor [Gemmatimonadaceae bacterium]
MSGDDVYTATKSDARVIAALSAGDERALGALYDRCGSVAYALAYAMTSNAATAEGVVADVFAHIWREAHKFQVGKMTLMAWLTSLVRERSLAIRRAANALHATPASRTPGPDQGEYTRTAMAPSAGRGTRYAFSTAPRVHLALGALSDVQRRAIELAYFEGLSGQEIALQLQLPESGVATHLRSAMETLRDSLAPVGPQGQPVVVGA